MNHIVIELLSTYKIAIDYKLVIILLNVFKASFFSIPTFAARDLQYFLIYLALKTWILACKFNSHGGNLFHRKSNVEERLLLYSFIELYSHNYLCV